MAITMSRTPTFVGCPPSYIRILPDTAANLPAIDWDHIPLPDGTMFHGLKPVSRVSPLNVSAMATINFGGLFSGILHGNDASSPGHDAARWAFHGIRWKPILAGISFTTVNEVSHGVWVASITGDGTAQGTIGKPPALPNRIVFNQNFIDGDQDQYGSGMGKLFRISLEYFAMVNSWVEGNWYSDGGQNELMEIGGSDRGPYLLENNYLPCPADNWFLTGGSTAATWPNIPSITMRRNDLAVPPSWLPSEEFTADAFGFNGWTFRVSSGGLTLTKTAGWNWFSSAKTLAWHSPRAGGFIWEPATGVARQVSTIDTLDGGGAGDVVTLTAPWPLADGVSFVGYGQMPPPMVLYQGGLTGNRAHTTAGSRTVTFDSPLPALAYDNCTPIAASTRVETGPFFYTNDTINRGDCGGAMAMSNNWGPGRGGGFTPSISPPYCWPRYDPAFGRPWQAGDTTWNPNTCRRRVEIVAIAGDRLSLTLASPYFETVAFTFSIVQHDGMYRLVGLGTKGGMELKSGDRMLYEANVGDTELPTTLHPQTNDPFYDVICNVTGDQVTLTGGTFATWPGGFKELVDAWVTYGGQDPIAMRRPQSLPKLVLYQGSAYPTKGRNFKSIDSPTTATLMPVDPRWQGNDIFAGAPNIVGGHFQLFRNTGPHWVVTNHITRYNICQPRSYGVFGSNLAGGHAENIGETDARQNNIIIHDNLLVYRNHKPILGQDAVTYSNWPIDGSFPIPSLSPIDGDWSDSYGRVSHNALVHTWPRASYPLLMVQQIAGFASPPPNACHHIEVADNIIDQWNCLFGGFFGPFTESQLLPLFGQPYTIARNILVKADAPTVVASNLGTTFAPDNCGLSTIDTVGFTNYPFVATDIANPDNYVLADVYASGTVSIDAPGTGVTLDSGSFPISVQPGQFFKAATTSTRTRIASMVQAGLGASWSSYTGFGVYTKSGGVAFPAGGAPANGRTFQTHTFAVGANQWGQVTLSALSGTGTGQGLAVRWAAPGAFTGYLVQLSAGNAVTIFRCDGVGLYTALATSTTTANVGDVLLFEANGSTLTASLNGTAVVSATSSTYPSGRVGLDVNTTSQATHYASFSLGDYSGGGGTRATLASDAFSGGGTTQLTLASAYDVALRGTSGNSYAITFKGTATDGTDPGPNIPLLKLLTAGVRRAP